MNTIKSILILSMLMHMTLLISAQQIGKDTIKAGITEKKWSFSLSFGATLLGSLGSGAALESELREIGFGRPSVFGSFEIFNFSEIFNSRNYKKYPMVKSAATWDMETRINLSNRSALALSLGKSHHYTAEGYREAGYKSFDGNGYDNYLTIVHDVWFVSADYVFRYAPGYGGIAVGPVLAMHRVSESGPTGQAVGSTGQAVKTTAVKPGFHVGVDLPLFQKQTWFMAFGLNYTWLPPTEIGPNTEKLRTSSGGGFAGVQRSGNQSNTIPLAKVQMCVTTGWRF